jgi:hypothetical protein
VVLGGLKQKRPLHMQYSMVKSLLGLNSILDKPFQVMYLWHFLMPDRNLFLVATRPFLKNINQSKSLFL